MNLYKLNKSDISIYWSFWKKNVHYVNFSIKLSLISQQNPYHHLGLKLHDNYTQKANHILLYIKADRQDLLSPPYSIFALQEKTHRPDRPHHPTPNILFIFKKYQFSHHLAHQGCQILLWLHLHQGLLPFGAFWRSNTTSTRLCCPARQRM